MTTPTTPGTSTTPPTDDELEARLAASWERSLAKAQDDLAHTHVVSVALAADRRRRVWRATGGALLGVAAVVLVGFAIIVGAGGRRDPVEPPASPGALGSPAAGLPTSSGSPAPELSPSADGIPYIDPLVPFPTTVDGRPVLPVGRGAEAALAAATDDSPVYISGWLIGTDDWGCANDFDLGSPAPNGIRWKACSAAGLRATADGGATLPVYMSYSSPDRLIRGPVVTMAMEVLLRVHAHDEGCLADDCAHKPVYDAVVQYRTPRIAPTVLAATMPPGAITSVEAIAAADAYLAASPSPYGDSWVLLRTELGSRLVVGNAGTGSDGDWVWVVWYVSKDGYYETTVYVEYRGGAVHESSSGNLRFP